MRLAVGLRGALGEVDAPAGEATHPAAHALACHDRLRLASARVEELPRHVGRLARG